MSTFEFTFGLVSLLLGLGFAHVAQCFAKLIVAGPQRVRWHWLPPLAALNAFQLGLVYWWFQYSQRDEQVVLGSMVLKALACLALYMMAVAALPETGRDGQVDLADHFSRSRRLYYSCWLIYVIIVSLVPLIAAQSHGDALPWPYWLVAANCVPVLLGLIVANRWIQTAVLALSLLSGAYTWLPKALS